MGPPLCITTGDIDEIVNILDDSFRELTAEVPQVSS